MLIKKMFLSLGRIERIIFVGAILILLLSFGIKSALYVEANTRLAPAEGGEFREGVIGQPVFINPIIPTTNTDRDMASLIFGSVYDIAETIKHSDDGKTWNVRLKQGLEWQDGEKLTSDDIIFTIETIQNKDARSPLYASFQGVISDRISELEVKFTLQSPYAFFDEEHLKNLSLIPKHIFGDSPVQNFKLSVYGLKPVGSGPYKVDYYEKDDRGVINAFYLSANDRYALGKPYISKFVFKFYKNEDELISAYNGNKIDGFLLPTSQRIVSDKQKNAETIEIRKTMHSLKSSRYYSIFINQAAPRKDLQNIKTREALSRSIDRETLVDKILGEYASSIYGPTLYTTELKSPPTDTKTVSTSSRKPSQNDNLPAGNILNGIKLTVIVPEEDFLLKTAEMVKSSWEKEGAEVALTVEPLKTLQERILKNRDYELLLLGNTLGNSNDLFSFWHSSRRFYPDQNLALYQDKKTDGLLESFRKNFNKNNRGEDLKKISDLIAINYPAIFLYSPNLIYISTPSLNGFQADQIINIDSDRFYKIEKWHLKTKRVL